VLATLALVGCTPAVPVPVQLTPSPAVATSVTTEQPESDPPAVSPEASVISVEGWGQLWASMPVWFEPPPKASPVPTTDQSASFTVPLAPAAAMTAIDRILRARDFSVESHENGPTFEAFYTWESDDTCELLVVAHAAPGGSRVDIRYPITCPR
jgi:hypothetical protein